MTVDHRFAIEFQQQAQHPVRGRVLRPHIQKHGLALYGAVRDQMGHSIKISFFYLCHNYSFAYGLRTSISSKLKVNCGSS